MYRKMISRVTLPVCFALILVWAMLASPGSSLANPPDGSGNHNHGGGGGGGDGSSSVIVTFRDFLGDDIDPVPDRLMSDDLGPYIRGEQNVGGGINKFGELTFATG